MKKVLVTENQLNTIKKFVQEEINNDRYEREVSVHVDTYDAKINGESIDWANCSKITLNYLIEQEHRRWGIKNISLYDIKGPSEVELTITPQVEDGEDVEIVVPLNWENIEQESLEGEGVITVGNEVTLVLGNNENGEIIVKTIQVQVYTL